MICGLPPSLLLRVLGRTLDNLGIEPPVFNTGQQLNALGKDKETFTQSSLRGLGIQYGQLTLNLN